MARCCQSEPEHHEGWFSLVWLDIKMGMIHMTLTMHLLFLCMFINSCIKKSEGPMNSLPERLLESDKSLFPAHEQPEGHQNVLLKSHRKLQTHFMFHYSVSSGGTLYWERFDPWAPSSSTWRCCLPTSFLPCSVTSSRCFWEYTVLATKWKSNKNLIISCQLFNVFFHSKMSSGWQQHAECNCACASAWWGSSPEGFPSRHVFTHLSLPNGLEQLYVYWYYYQHCYHQSRLFGTLDSFTRAMYCTCQHDFIYLFSSSLFQMPETHCGHCNRYLTC